MNGNDMQCAYWAFMEPYNGRTSTLDTRTAFFAGWEAAVKAAADRLLIYDPITGEWREFDRATVTVTESK